MASVAPPKPSYRPRVPERIVADGLMSDAQLESVIYAGEAHSAHLQGSWVVDATYDGVSAAPDDAKDAVRFRRGWFLGDGTGAGKALRVCWPCGSRHENPSFLRCSICVCVRQRAREWL